MPIHEFMIYNPVQKPNCKKFSTIQIVRVILENSVKRMSEMKIPYAGGEGMLPKNTY